MANIIELCARYFICIILAYSNNNNGNSNNNYNSKAGGRGEVENLIIEYLLGIRQSLRDLHAYDI